MIKWEETNSSIKNEKILRKSSKRFSRDADSSTTNSFLNNTIRIFLRIKSWTQARKYCHIYARRLEWAGYIMRRPAKEMIWRITSWISLRLKKMEEGHGEGGGTN